MSASPRPSSMVSKPPGPSTASISICMARWSQTISTTAKEKSFARVRQAIGKDLPLVVSLDLHATSRLRWWSMPNALICLSDYPHIDMADTGRAARKTPRAAAAHESGASPKRSGNCRS